MIKKLRDPVSGLTHFFAARLAAPGVVLLLALSWGDPARQVTLLLYGIGLMMMFGSSAAYHMIQARPKVVLALRKLDHAAIYIMIAGSYTPVCFHYLSGGWRTGMLITIWALALIGIGVKMFVIQAPRWLTAGIYLLMGWLALIAIGQIVQLMPGPALAWLIAGGLFFTIGAVIYVTKWPDFVPNVFGFHEVWHIFVILGGVSHFILIAAFIAPA